MLDAQGNIRRLIDSETNTIAAHYTYSAFGEQPITEQPLFNPWQYATKRLDPDLSLIDFGKRHYDPQLGRWLTLDPIGFLNNRNLYQYNFNDPFRYRDPNGTFAFALFIPVVEITLDLIVTWITAEAVVGTVAGAALGYGVYHVAQGIAGVNADEAAVYQEAEAPKEEKKKEPPYKGDQLGNDPTKCPDEGFEWKGTGPAGSKQGNWVKGKGENQEWLRPDLDHPPPIKPHWDYVGPGFREGVRLNIDGTWGSK